MASGSSGTIGTSNAMVKIRLDWSSVSNGSAANSSNVTASVYAWRTNTGYSTYGPGTLTIGMYGESVPINMAGKTITSTVTCIGTATRTFAHNADGTKSIILGASLNMPSVLTGQIDNMTCVLDIIPRTSVVSLSATSFTISNNVVVYTNRASTSFTHSVELHYGAISKTIATGVTDSWSWVGTADLFSQLGNYATSGSGYIRLVTNQTGGWTDIGFTCYVPAVSVPTLSNANYNITEAITLYTNTSYSGYAHEVHIYKPSSADYFLAASAVTSSCSLNTTAINTVLYAQIPNTKKLDTKLLLRTINNGIIIGDRELTFSANVVNSLPTFSAFTYTQNNAATATLLGNSTGVVQGQSSLAVTLTGAAAINSATLVLYAVLLSGIVYTSTTDIVTVPAITANDILYAYVIDSRGNESAKRQVNFAAYYTWSAPTVAITLLHRTNDIDVTATLAISGVVSALMVTKNKHTFSYRYKKSTETVWSAYVAIETNTAALPTPYIYSALLPVTFSLDVSYNFEVLVTDYYSSATVVGLLQTSQPELSIRKDKIGINKIPTQGALDVVGDGYIAGNLNTTGNNITTGQAYNMLGTLKCNRTPHSFELITPTYTMGGSGVGVLLTTNIAATSSTMLLLEIKGNSFDVLLPIDTLVQAFRHGTGGTIRARVLNSGDTLSVTTFILDGVVCFWFMQTGSNQTIFVKISTDMASNPTVVTSLVPMPTTGVTESQLITNINNGDAHPIGSVYTSFVTTSPALLFGGSWERINDSFLWASSSSTSAGNRGGSRYHTHGALNTYHGTLEACIGSVASNTLTIGFKSGNDNNVGAPGGSTYTVYGSTNSSGQSFNHFTKIIGETASSPDTIPPYTETYMWKRIS